MVSQRRTVVGHLRRDLAVPGAAREPDPEGAEGPLQELGPRVRVVDVAAAVPAGDLRTCVLDPRRRLRLLRHLAALRPRGVDLREHRLHDRHAGRHQQRLPRDEGPLPAGRAPAGQRRRRAGAPLPAVAVFGVVLVVLRHDVDWEYMWLLPIAVVTMLVFAGLGMLLAATNVYARDTGHLLDLLVARLVLADADPVPVQRAAAYFTEHGFPSGTLLINPVTLRGDHVPAGDLRQELVSTVSPSCPTGRRSGTCGTSSSCSPWRS